MAIDASELYRRFRHEHRLSTADSDLMGRAAAFINTADQSKALEGRSGLKASSSHAGASEIVGFLQ